MSERLITTVKDEDYKDLNDKITEMNTSSAVVNKQVEQRNRENFRVTRQSLYAPTNDGCYAPAEVEIDNLEGQN